MKKKMDGDLSFACSIFTADKRYGGINESLYNICKVLLYKYVFFVGTSVLISRYHSQISEAFASDIVSVSL